MAHQADLAQHTGGYVRCLLTNDFSKAGRGRRSLHGALAVGVVVTALVAALVAPGSAATDTADTTGVTAKEIEVGYIYSEAGLAGSTFAYADDGFNARVDAAERGGRRQRSQDRAAHRRRQRIDQQPRGGAGPRAEREDLPRRQQLPVHVPRLPLPARQRRPDGGRGLRRQRVRPAGQREAHLHPRQQLAGVRRAVQGWLRRPHEEGGGEERRHRVVRRVGVVDRLCAKAPGVRGARRRPQPGVHEHDRRVRHDRRRTARARDEERRRRHGVPAARAVDEPRDRADRRRRTT